MHRLMTKTTPLLLILALVLAACGGLAGEPEVVGQIPTSPPAPQQQESQSVALVAPSTAPDLALGEELYAMNCVRCHGDLGAGDGEFVLSGQISADAIPDFTDSAQTAGDTPQQYYEAVTNGNLAALMPPFTSLSDEERWAVANYVLTLDGNSDDVAVAASNDDSDTAGADDSNATETDTSATGADASDPHAGIDTAAAQTDPNDPHAGLDIEIDENAEPITITGTLLHGTEGGVLPENTSAQLRVVTMAGEQESYETAVSADGVYAFEDVPYNPLAGYFVSVRYNDNTFNSEFISGRELVEEGAPLTVTVFDVTNDASALKFNYVLTQMDYLEDGSLRIWQAYNLTNTSDKVFMQEESNGHMVSVAIPMPPNAMVSEVSETSRFIPDIDAGIVYDLMPVRPDTEHTFNVVYTVAASDARNYQLSQSFDYDFVGPFEAYYNPESATVSGNGLTEIGQQNLNGTSYTGIGLITGPEANETLTLRVSTVGGGFGDLLNSQTTAYGMMVLGAVLVVAAGALLFVGRGGNGLPTADDPQARIKSLMAQIADLDDQFESNAISRKAYEEKRGALKDELTTLMSLSN